MKSGQRVKCLMERYGDTVEKAAARTGVPKSTLHRITQGSEANLNRWLPKIAAGYGVALEYLQGGSDPRMDFEWSIRSASSRERFEFCLMTIQERVYLTIEFLMSSYGQKYSVRHKSHSRAASDQPI